MRTLKLTLAYEGTEYVGWQRQAAGTSIQGSLEHAMGRLAGVPVAVAGAGRTDAGVHAAAQVASCVVDLRQDGDTLRRALNAMLPGDIRVLEVMDAADDFHARFSALSKTYHYRITNGPVASPFARRWSWHVPWTLDVPAMQEAALGLAGEHDFSAFQSAGTEVRSTIRRLHVSHVLETPAGTTVLPPGAHPEPASGERRLVYEVRGTGFLRHMVRAIAGTLVEVGSRRLRPEEVKALLTTPARKDAGPTAPAGGLCLAAVHYADGRGERPED